MLVKVKADKNKNWGFLEQYDSYYYEGKGYVKALVGVKIDKTLTMPYVYRGEEFISLDLIDAEVGIDRYIKAKKPFYSMIEGCFIVVLKAVVDYTKKEYIPEKSTFELYTPNLNSSDLKDRIPLKKVLDVPVEVRTLVEEPLRLLGESFGNREQFLRSRIYGKDNS